MYFKKLPSKLRFLSPPIYICCTLFTMNCDNFCFRKDVHASEKAMACTSSHSPPSLSFARNVAQLPYGILRTNDIEENILHGAFRLDDAKIASFALSRGVSPTKALNAGFAYPLFLFIVQSALVTALLFLRYEEVQEQNLKTAWDSEWWEQKNSKCAKCFLLSSGAEFFGCRGSLEAIGFFNFVMYCTIVGSCNNVSLFQFLKSTEPLVICSSSFPRRDLPPVLLFPIQECLKM